jgi:hypothetical protein
LTPRASAFFAHAIRERRIPSHALQKSRVLLDRTGSLTGVGSWETDLVSGEIHWDAQIYRLDKPQAC